MDIYNFDYELRHIIPQYVEIIEVQMKSLFPTNLPDYMVPSDT